MPASTPAIDFGLFDWIDFRAAPVDQIFEERLQLLEYADQAGFYCYHPAEHHATPLSLAPSPGLFLGAASQRTRRIRLGTLVYLLPLYNPLRLLKEVAMLDQLSGGRFELGVGRGVSPYELRYFGVDARESRAIFLEALEVLRLGLTRDHLTFIGPSPRRAASIAIGSAASFISGAPSTTRPTRHGAISTGRWRAARYCSGRPRRCGRRSPPWSTRSAATTSCSPSIGAVRRTPRPCGLSGSSPKKCCPSSAPNWSAHEVGRPTWRRGAGPCPGAR